MDVMEMVRGAVGLAKAAVGAERRSEDGITWCTRRCTTCVEHERYELGGVEYGFCGRFGEKGKAGPVCHCLVTVTIRGVTKAAGKLLVKGESCPQERFWGEK